ncbi:histidinol-phosphatase HisJ [Robertmurraya beringensis]|uniref:Histidinol-phosphatase n=1 Tax=Robertmurraya beringensis TaxID=641660 RepID=A0ABV6KLE4_9BACI
MRDGHVHSKFCPHGSKDAFQTYIEHAMELGITTISFTEHAPLPAGFTDPTPLQDSAMKMEDLPAYLEELAILRDKYRGKITIHTGLEVDYIEGFEKETTEFLNKYGPFLTDSILSVHFLKHEGEYDCLDYSPDVFGDMIKRYGGIEKVYEAYFRTLLLSIKSNLGSHKPKRIGHITLVNKFQKKYPCPVSFNKEIRNILLEVQQNNYELDYNGAGTAKPLCLEPYPPTAIANQAIQLNIPMIYGSDAHQAKELLQGYEQLHRS